MTVVIFRIFPKKNQKLKTIISTKNRRINIYLVANFFSHQHYSKSIFPFSDMDVTDRTNDVLDPLLPDNYLEEYKLQESWERGNYLMNLLYVHLQLKMNNQKVKSQFDLLGLEQNNNSTEVRRQIYELHVVSEELKALKPTTTSTDMQDYQKIIKESLPPIIDFCTSIIAPRTKMDQYLLHHHELFDSHKYNKSKPNNNWILTLQAMSIHSQKQINDSAKKNNNGLDFLEENGIPSNNNFLLSKDRKSVV